MYKLQFLMHICRFITKFEYVVILYTVAELGDLTVFKMAAVSVILDCTKFEILTC